MGRHQENITRLVCGAITCAVSFCLLTCAFVNVAYADYNDLPNSYTDETGGNYNPEGTLFGTTSLLFTDAWYADETIFSQSLSGAFQIVQDKTAIYTAIVADCVRQSNNWLAQIKSYVEETSSTVSTISNDTGNLLLELRFNSYGVNGTTTKTIRGIVKDIADAMVTNNASLQQIKEQFEDEHGSNYLYQIFNNTRNIDYIYQQLANGTSGTISGTVNSINSKIATVSSNVILIKDALGSGGYIGQQLSGISSTLSNISTNLGYISNYLTRTQYRYTNSAGSEVWYERVMVLSPDQYNSQSSTWVNGVYKALQDIKTALQNQVPTDLSGVLDALGSGGYIGQKLNDLATVVNTIKNDLHVISNSVGLFQDSNGNPVYYLRSMPLMSGDPQTETWASQVRSYLLNISTKANSILDALGSGGYIGQQLSGISSTLSTISTNLNSDGPINTTLTSAVSYLNYINQKLTADGPINTTLTSAVSYLNYINQKLTADGPINTTLTSAVSYLIYINQKLTADGPINTTLNSINATLSNISDSISNIATYISRIQYRYINSGGNEVWFERAIILSPDRFNSQTSDWVNGVYIALQDIKNSMQNIPNLSNVEQWLDSIAANNEAYHEELMGKLSKIILLLSVPDDDPFGDFDEDLFKTKTDELIDNISQLAPFGAILVASMELSILTQVDPITKPELNFPFDFFGFGNMVTLDLSWLDDAKPLFNFFTEFLFILALLNISMKYVRQEATS